MRHQTTPRAVQMLAAVALLATGVRGNEHQSIASPSYYYGSPIQVECMTRNSYAPLSIFT